MPLSSPAPFLGLFKSNLGLMGHVECGISRLASHLAAMFFLRPPLKVPQQTILDQPMGFRGFHRWLVPGSLDGVHRSVGPFARNGSQSGPELRSFCEAASRVEATLQLEEALLERRLAAALGAGVLSSYRVTMLLYIVGYSSFCITQFSSLFKGNS